MFLLLLIQPFLGSPSDYFRQLKEETDKDKSLQQYLEWIVAQDVPKPLLQCLPDWLHNLCNADYSSMLAVIDLRSALSFREVDYLPLPFDSFTSGLSFVKSDPAALGPLRESFAESKTSNDRKIHPALIRLSVDHSTPSPGAALVPTFVLPVGRVLSVNKPSLVADDSIKDEIMSSYPRLLSKRFQYGSWACHCLRSLPMSTSVLSQVAPAARVYTSEVVKRFDAGMTSSEMWRDQVIEQYRREVLQAVMKGRKLFHRIELCCGSRCRGSQSPSMAYS